MKRFHLSKAAATMISLLPAEIRARLRFKNDKPSPKWLSSFYARHKLLYNIMYPVYKNRNDKLL